jgi:hypothetical protein
MARNAVWLTEARRHRGKTEPRMNTGVEKRPRINANVRSRNRESSRRAKKWMVSNTNEVGPACPAPRILKHGGKGDTEKMQNHGATQIYTELLGDESLNVKTGGTAIELMTSHLRRLERVRNWVTPAGLLFGRIGVRIFRERFDAALQTARQRPW